MTGADAQPDPGCHWLHVDFLSLKRYFFSRGDLKRRKQSLGSGINECGGGWCGGGQNHVMKNMRKIISNKVGHTVDSNHSFKDINWTMDHIVK